MKSRLKGNLTSLRDKANYSFDERGYTPLQSGLEFTDSTREEVVEYLKGTDEYSILNNMIRANSGHNFTIVPDEHSEVPPILIHSTPCDNVCSIIDGDKLLGYPVVSLSTDFKEAYDYAKDKSPIVVHLLLDARLMLLDGLKIMNTGTNTFNVIEEIPQKYVVGILEHSDGLTDIPSLKDVDPEWTEKMSYKLDDNGADPEYLNYLGIE